MGTHAHGPEPATDKPLNLGGFSASDLSPRAALRQADTAPGSASACRDPAEATSRRRKGAGFISVESTTTEVRDVLDQVGDSQTEAAAYLAGARQKRLV